MHILMLYPSEKDMVHGLIRGLALPLHLVSDYLIVVRFFFSQVVDYLRAMERSYIETYGGSGKIPSIGIVSLVFHTRVQILPVEVSFIYSLLVLCK